MSWRGSFSGKYPELLIADCALRPSLNKVEKDKKIRKMSS